MVRLRLLFRHALSERFEPSKEQVSKPATFLATFTFASAIVFLASGHRTAQAQDKKNNRAPQRPGG